MQNHNGHLSILQAMTHIKQNISPIAAQTFEQALKEKPKGQNVTAHKLGEIMLNEPILDTTLFLRQITMAMYPNYVYPADWLKKD
jgi:hypothetical protein